MKEKKKFILLAVSLTGFIALGVLPALAQEKPADNMQILLDKIKADGRAGEVGFSFHDSCELLKEIITLITSFFTAAW